MTEVHRDASTWHNRAEKEMQIQNWPFLPQTWNVLFTQICSLHCDSVEFCLLYLGLGFFQTGESNS